MTAGPCGCVMRWVCGGWRGMVVWVRWLGGMAELCVGVMWVEWPAGLAWHERPHKSQTLSAAAKKVR